MAQSTTAPFQMSIQQQMRDILEQRGGAESVTFADAQRILELDEVEETAWDNAPSLQQEFSRQSTAALQSVESSASIPKLKRIWKITLCLYRMSPYQLLPSSGLAAYGSVEEGPVWSNRGAILLGNILVHPVFLSKRDPFFIRFVVYLAASCRANSSLHLPHFTPGTVGCPIVESLCTRLSQITIHPQGQSTSGMLTALVTEIATQQQASANLSNLSPECQLITGIAGGHSVRALPPQGRDEFGHPSRTRRAIPALINDFKLIDTCISSLPGQITTSQAYTAWWKVRDDNIAPTTLDQARELMSLGWLSELKRNFLKFQLPEADTDMGDAPFEPTVAATSSPMPPSVPVAQATAPTSGVQAPDTSDALQETATMNRDMSSTPHTAPQAVDRLLGPRNGETEMPPAIPPEMPSTMASPPNQQLLDQLSLHRPTANWTFSAREKTTAGLYIAQQALLALQADGPKKPPSPAPY